MEDKKMDPVELYRIWRKFEGKNFAWDKNAICTDLDKELEEIDMAEINTLEKFKGVYPNNRKCIELFEALEFISGSDQFMLAGGHLINQEGQQS